MGMWNLPRTEKEAVLFFQEKGLLPRVMKCRNGHEMALYVKEGPGSMWRCSKMTCRVNTNMRVGNWFSGSKLHFLKIARFIFFWSEQLTSIKFCKRHLKLGEGAIVDWNNYMRDVCVKYMEQRGNQKIGGDGIVVEIDESLFSRRKNHCERVFYQQWVFGGICRETGDCFLVQVPNRRFSTLFPIIKEYILEGSVIYSDSWKAYQMTEREREGFRDFKANHSYNFVDSTTDVHTQHIEKLWGSAKWRNKRHRGTVRHHVESYFAEFMWRHHIRDKSPFEEILSTISQYWPPQDHI